MANANILLALNSLLKGLNSIRKCYSESDILSNLDLVTCNILDIVRCKCVGSKRDIRRVYEDLLKQKEYEIIRVKIKLNESTRDVIINFKCKGSFLIGEMQLALGSKDNLNEQFCHYLYELQRSIFPVLYEVSGQIVSHDYRVSYFAGGDHLISFWPRKGFGEISR